MTGDERLIRDAAGSDLDALRELLKRHGATVRQRVNGQIGRQWRAVLDADDVMQVTYLEAFLEIENLRARDVRGFLAWLQRIAENNVRDAVKELSRQKRPQPANRALPAASHDSHEALLEELGTAVATPSRQATRHERKQRLLSALDELPTDYRTVVSLYDLDGIGVADVAARMGRSPGAVFMLRARAHRWLQQILGSPSSFLSDRA